MQAAANLFLENGFAGTSMDAIASAAGVSKLTVYSHFGDKDHLFHQVVTETCKRLLPEDLYRSRPGKPLRETLLDIARHHVRLMISPEAVGIWRAINSDCRNGSPRMGSLFWDAGPGRSRALMEQFLGVQVAAGSLDIEDIPLAASQLMTLLKGDIHTRLLLGCMESGCQQDERLALENAESSVDMFLRAYAPR